MHFTHLYCCVLLQGMIEELGDYIERIYSLTITQWGEDEVNEVANDKDLKPGGIANLGRYAPMAQDGMPKCPFTH